MLYCTFYQKLRKLNPRLRIIGDDAAPARPWGLYEVGKWGEKLTHVCGISHAGGSVYELTERRWDGYILRQGWRRVLTLLIKAGMIDKKKAASEFGTSFEGNRGRGFTVQKDPLTKAMDEARARGLAKTGVEKYVELDDLVDIHRMREKYRQDKSNYWA